MAFPRYCLHRVNAAYAHILNNRKIYKKGIALTTILQQSAVILKIK